MRRPRHWSEEHVSEVCLRVEAATQRELFEEAGRALAELSADVAPEEAFHAEERVELRARDRGALLVAWLNELIFRSETRKLVYDGLSVQQVDDTSLVALVRGREPKSPRTAVKAATMHGVRIEQAANGFTAAVVLDV